MRRYRCGAIIGAINIGAALSVRRYQQRRTSEVNIGAALSYSATGLAQVTELGTCKKQAADGSPCDTTLGPTCYTGARCVTAAGSSAGVCTIPDVASCQ